MYPYYEITPHNPVALELANSHPSFVEKARLWQWKKYDKRLPVGAGWPPGISGSFGVYDYWYELLQRNRRYNLDNFVEPTSLETAVNLALAFAELDPMIELAYALPQWLTIRIAGKNELVRADRVVGWSRFAGSTYDVTLDDSRTGRVDDAAFELKVAV